MSASSTVRMLAESRRQSQHEYDAGAAVKVKRDRARAFLEHERTQKVKGKSPRGTDQPGSKAEGT